MPEEFVYRIDKEFTLEQLQSIRSRARESFEGFVDFNSEESRQTYLGPMTHLPKLEEFPGVGLLDVVTTGNVSTKEDPWSIFEEVFARGSKIASLGAVEILCGFEEGSSRQTKRGYDSVGLHSLRGRLFFSYDASGSKVSSDPTYRRDFVKEMIQVLRLPLVFEEKDGHFTLKHADNGQVRILRAMVGGLDPEAFWFELPGESYTSALDTVRAFLDEFATKKRFTNQWIVRRDFGGSAEKQPELSKRIYDLLVSLQLPANSYELDLEFRAEELGALDAVREFLGSKGTMFSRLCSFDLLGDNYGEFTIITASAGHQLELVLRHPEGLPIVEDRFAMKFHEA